VFSVEMIGSVIILSRGIVEGELQGVACGAGPHYESVK
jgi:hypothetical protein